MDDFFRNTTSKIIIAILILLAVGIFSYNYIYEKKKSNQILVVERKAMKARLVELKMDKAQYLVKIQDTVTGEVYDDIFVSKICPVFEQNQLGKIMDIQKTVFYRVKDDLKEDGFEGLYDYICTTKKEQK